MAFNCDNDNYKNFSFGENNKNLIPIYSNDHTIDTLPDSYKLAYTQAYLFLIGLKDCKYTLFINGGVVLDYLRFYKLNEDKTYKPKCKDIDFSVALPGSCSIEYYKDQINNMDQCLQKYYKVNKHFIAKLGDYEGTNPPTSQFDFNNKNATEILSKNQDLPPKILDMLKFLASKQEEDFEYLDVIPILGENNKPKPDLKTDAERRDFTINAMYIEMIIDDKKDGSFHINVYDPLNSGYNDLQKVLLRTPLDPYETFMNDGRRLMRIFKMTVKLSDMFPNQIINYSPELMEFIDNDDKFKQVKDKLEKRNITQFNTRNPMDNDLSSVMSSIHYPKVVDILLRHKNLFTFLCVPYIEIKKPIPVDAICNDILKLLNPKMCDNMTSLDYNSLITMITCYVHIDQLHITNDTQLRKNSYISDLNTKTINNPGLYNLFARWTQDLKRFKNITVLLQLADYIIFYGNTNNLYAVILNNDPFRNEIIKNNANVQCLLNILIYFQNMINVKLPVQNKFNQNFIDMINTCSQETTEFMTANPNMPGKEKGEKRFEIINNYAKKLTPLNEQSIGGAATLDIDNMANQLRIQTHKHEKYKTRYLAEQKKVNYLLSLLYNQK